MFWEMQVSQNVKLFLTKRKNLFSNINILNIFYVSLVYKQKEPLADVLQTGYS